MTKGIVAQPRRIAPMLVAALVLVPSIAFAADRLSPPTAQAARALPRSHGESEVVHISTYGEINEHNRHGRRFGVDEDAVLSRRLVGFIQVRLHVPGDLVQKSLGSGEEAHPVSMQMPLRHHAPITLQGKVAHFPAVANEAPGTREVVFEFPYDLPDAKPVGNPPVPSMNYVVSMQVRAGVSQLLFQKGFVKSRNPNEGPVFFRNETSYHKDGPTPTRVLPLRPGQERSHVASSVRDATNHTSQGETHSSTVIASPKGGSSTPRPRPAIGALVSRLLAGSRPRP